jgi:hypothetical protein
VNVTFSEVQRQPADGLVAMVEAGASTDLRWLDCLIDHSRRYSVIQTRDNFLHGMNAPPDWRWHISVAGEKDVPRWKDLVAIVQDLRPGVFFCVGLPPRSMWMSHHPHTLHATEIKDDTLIEQWRMEGRAMRSTPT